MQGPVIELAGLRREFRQAKRFDGAFGAVRTLLTREYTVRTALDDISLSVQPGESVAYLGPNGAGKSTTIKILTGLLVPSAGRVRVLGNEPHAHRQENARRIGVVFGQRSQLWWDLPLYDSFDLHRRIYRIEQERFQRNLAFCEEVLRMEAFSRRRYANSASGSGCAVNSRWPCSTSRRCSSSTNRPSGSMCWRRIAFASS